MHLLTCSISVASCNDHERGRASRAAFSCGSPSACIFSTSAVIDQSACMHLRTVSAAHKMALDVLVAALLVVSSSVAAQPGVPQLARYPQEQIQACTDLFIDGCLHGFWTVQQRSARVCSQDGSMHPPTLARGCACTQVPPDRTAFAGPRIRLNHKGIGLGGGMAGRDPHHPKSPNSWPRRLLAWRNFFTDNSDSTMTVGEATGTGMRMAAEACVVVWGEVAEAVVAFDAACHPQQVNEAAAWSAAKRLHILWAALDLLHCSSSGHRTVGDSAVSRQQHGQSLNDVHGKDKDMQQNLEPLMQHGFAAHDSPGHGAALTAHIPPRQQRQACAEACAIVWDRIAGTAQSFSHALHGRPVVEAWGAVKRLHVLWSALDAMRCDDLVRGPDPDSAYGQDLKPSNIRDSFTGTPAGQTEDGATGQVRSGTAPSGGASSPTATGDRRPALQGVVAGPEWISQAAAACFRSAGRRMPVQSACTAFAACASTVNSAWQRAIVTTRQLLAMVAIAWWDSEHDTWPRAGTRPISAAEAVVREAAAPEDMFSEALAGTGEVVGGLAAGQNE